MAIADFCGPCALDETEDGDDLVIGQNALVSGHGRLVVFEVRGSRQTKLGDVEQNLIGMMPGVSGFIVRGRRQQSIGSAGPPVGLALEIDAVARGAIFFVDHSAQGDGLGIFRTQQCSIVGTALFPEEESGTNREDKSRGADEEMMTLHGITRRVR